VAVLSSDNFLTLGSAYHVTQKMSTAIRDVHGTNPFGGATIYPILGMPKSTICSPWLPKQTPEIWATFVCELRQHGKQRYPELPMEG